MSIPQESIPVTGPIEAAEFSAANSIAYLSAVFAAWRAGDVVLAKPGSSAISDVPGIRIIRREEFTNAPGWFEETLAPGPADQPAQISFSSGTTGQPKALLLTHGALNDVVTRINTAMEVDATIREYIGVPVTFSFGFGRARAVAAAGRRGRRRFGRCDGCQSRRGLGDPSSGGHKSKPASHSQPQIAQTVAGRIWGVERPGAQRGEPATVR